MRCREKHHAPSRILRSAGVLLGLLVLAPALPARATTPLSRIVTVAGNHGAGGTYGGDGSLATDSSVGFFIPTGVAVDASGNLYIADLGNYVIRKVDHATGIISTVAGNGSHGYSGDRSLAIHAQLNNPYEVAIDASGNLYITDSGNSVIREVSVNSQGRITDASCTSDCSTISTVAGNGSYGYSGDGSFAASAELNSPYGVAIDASGNLYIADSGNNVIRKVSVNSQGRITDEICISDCSTISTVAGNGSPGYSGDGSLAASAKLYTPYGVEFDASGNLYIVDTFNNVIRKVDDATGIISTVAGNGSQGRSGDGSPATSAELFFPTGVTADASGNLYIADSDNSVIRKVDHATGIITTFAGNGGVSYSGDGSQATRAELFYPAGVAIDASGNLFIADTGNSVIRKVTTETTYASVALNSQNRLTVTLTFFDLAGGAGTPTIYAGLDGAPLTAIASGSGTVVGTVTVSGSGPHTLTFYSIDSAGTSEVPQTLSLTVPAPPPPTANPQTVSLHFGVITPVTLSATDTDGDALTYSVLTSPTNGALTGTAPNLTYHPANHFTGSDSFTFRAMDGTVASNTATISINVTDTAPVANSQSVTTSQRTALPITLSASDPDGDPITSYSVYMPVHGTLVKVSLGQYTYTPPSGFVGTDSFLFKANDGPLSSTAATVSIAVTAAAPTANPQTVSLHFGVITPVTLSATDTDGHALAYSVLTSPSHGTLTGTAPHLTYHPANHFIGSDSFTFQATDGTVASNTATISINVTDTAPVAASQSVSTRQGTPLPITLSASDPDGDPITSYSVYLPAHGTLMGTAPHLTYTPPPGFIGTDSFLFKANDGPQSSTAVTVTITVAS